MSALPHEIDIDIRDEWIDYNGHVSDAAYGVIVALANEALLETVDLSASYLERTGRSLFTAEAHIWYLSEVKRGRVHAVSSVTDLRDKSVRVKTSLFRADGVEAAKSEHVYVHVDHGAAKAVSFDESARVALTNLAVDQTAD